MASVIYQVFVDRFARGGAAREGLRDWHAPPAEPPRGEDQYGGDLDGIAQRLDHVVAVGADAIYLTPIFAAPSNHKYDTTDYERVDPSFGGDEAFDRLAAACRARGIGLILDGVFNHVGEAHAWTRERRHLLSGSVWRGYGHLPELDLGHPEVRAHFFGDDGVIARWTRRGAPGWRLDCANDLGPEACALAARAARAAGARDGTVGELLAYPAGFTPGGDRLDGVMNYWLRSAALGLASGRLAPEQAQEALDRLAREMAPGALAASWNVLSSHDTPRLETVLAGDAARIRQALVLAFAYPGIPLVYYGEEIGMRGGADPANRAGMIWDAARWQRERLELTRRLCRLKREEPALAGGRYVAMPQPGTGVVAFARETGRPADTLVCVLNATDEERAARLFVPLWFLFDAVPLEDLLSDARATMEQGCVDVRLPPRAALLFKPRDAHAGGYRFFKEPK